MPEGDTIRRMAAAIAERFQGRTVTRATFRHPRLATADLEGLELVSADARGKHLLLRFSNESSVHAHMLMQGRVALGSRTNTPEWRRRFELEFDSGVITGIDVPKLDLIRTRSEERRLAHLGPDLCGVYDHAEAVRRVEQAVDVPLTGAMLDQRLIAGFGNIYAVEVPFICGISPLQRVGSIEDVDSVIAVGAALIRTNARLGPQRTVGRASQSINQWVLPRERRRCPICGDALSRHSGSQSPWRRRFATCPSCQPIEETTTVNLTRVHSLLEDHPAIKMLDIERGVLTEPTDTPVEVGRRSQRSS